jgi:DNA ligase-1
MMRPHITVKSGAITKPLLAGRIEDGNKLEDLKFPVGLTNKIDGLRCLMIDGQAVSRTFKPLPNKHIRETLEKHCPNGMDMEITSGLNFQEATGNVMREDGVNSFHVHVIDYVPSDLDEPYKDRIAAAEDYAKKHWSKVPFTWEILTPTIAKNVKDIDAYEAKALAAGHEGVMIRDLDAPYKCGRSSFNQGILIKLKRFEDQEAEVIAVEEMTHNDNVAEKDAFGRSKRSTAQENLRPAGVLGTLVVRGSGGKFDGVEWRVGSGFTMEQREKLWKEKLVGKLVKVKYFGIGVDKAPRFPVFMGFRHPDDR